MKLLSYPVLLMLAIPLSFSSCLEKDNEEIAKTVQTCKVNKVLSEDGEYLKFEYDDKQRIVKVMESNDPNEEETTQSIIYNSDKILAITPNTGGVNPNDTTTYTIKNGRITSSVLIYRYKSYNDYIITSTDNRKFEYDADGNLVKITETSLYTSNEPQYEATSHINTIIYAYEDGNVISREDINDDINAVHKETYEYYTDRPVLIAGFGQNAVDELVNPNAKNLLKKMSTTNYNGVTTEDYTYIFNAEGLPTTMGIVTRYPNTSSPDIRKEVLEYKCSN